MTDRILSWARNPVKKRQYVLVSGDVIIGLTALAAAVGVRASIAGDSLANIISRLDPLVVVLMILIQLTTFFIFDLYSLRNRFARARTAALVVLADGAILMAISAVLFFLRPVPLGRTILVSYAVIMPLAAYGWRAAFFRSLGAVWRKDRVLFIGVDACILELLSSFGDHAIARYEIVGVLVDEEGSASKVPDGVQVVSGGEEQLQRLLDGGRVDTIVYSVRAKISDRVLQTMLEMHGSEIAVYDAPSFYSRIYEKVPIASIDARWLAAAVRQHRGSAFSMNLRRLTEIFLCILIGAITLPLFAVVVLAIKLEDRGQALYTQERLGLGRRPFLLYKFRTMIADAEAQTGPVWIRKRDPRITRVGWVLRRTGLDELPQLLNILRGEMTFVGIRPIRQHFAELLAQEIPFYDVRFSIRPGVTGWAQVNYGYGSSKRGQLEKLQYELFYLENASWLLDLFIVLKTVRKIAFLGFSSPDGKDAAGSHRVARRKDA